MLAAELWRRGYRHYKINLRFCSEKRPGAPKTMVSHKTRARSVILGQKVKVQRKSDLFVTFPRTRLLSLVSRGKHRSEVRLRVPENEKVCSLDRRASRPEVAEVA